MGEDGVRKLSEVGVGYVGEVGFFFFFSRVWEELGKWELERSLDLTSEKPPRDVKI